MTAPVIGWQLPPPDTPRGTRTPVSRMRSGFGCCVRRSEQSIYDDSSGGEAECKACIFARCPELVPIVSTWERLPAMVRRGILAMLQTIDDIE